MMSSQSDLKKLRSEWYAKLKESGFKDIEKEEGLITYEAAYFSDKALKNPGDFEARQDFYSKATEFGELYKFKRHKDFRIWQLFALGHTAREISKMLAEEGLRMVALRTVQDCIEKHLEIMKNSYL